MFPTIARFFRDAGIQYPLCGVILALYAVGFVVLGCLAQTH